MEAGRKLDALVAEKVMGWQWLRMDLDLWPEGKGHEWGVTRSLRPDASNGVWTLPAPLDWPVHHDTSHIPAFSTDIVAAWQVWKKVPSFSPFKQGMFFSALRAHVAARMDKDYRWTDAAAALHMQPVDICNSALEAFVDIRTLPDWYYE